MSVEVQPRESVRKSWWDTPGWPLAVLFLGFPLWWVMGLAVMVFFLVAIPMLVYLYRRRDQLIFPRGFSIWLLFLGVVVLSGFTLIAHAPSAIEGYGMPGRAITYLFNLGWYVSLTTVLVYVVNIREEEMPFARVSRWLAFMFIATTVGGLLGLALPDLKALGVLGQLLPKPVTQYPFVNDLVSIDVADVQQILGFEEPRPKAPFAYANSWGANLSMFLPFFVYSWVVLGSRVKRYVWSPIILVGAVVAAVYSLNRTLWGAVIVGGIYGLVQLVRLRPRAIVPVAAGIAVAAAVFILSGLGGIVTERLNNPHSDDRRSQLSSITLDSVLQGSPVIGFGNTRDMQGSFSSIAGGDTASCGGGCGVPPMGTQGYLWTVLFTTGLVGAGLFFSFLLYRMSRHVTTRDGPTIAAFLALVFMLVEMPYYDLLGPPLFTAMICLGLMWRRAQLTSKTEPASTGVPDG